MTFFAADGLVINFGGIRAVDGVSFEVEQGQVFTIIGPNGAGKTTIFNLISRIYDASARYTQDGTPLIVIAGKEYGSGSSRDWAAKGPLLLNVKAAIAESFERIHRSNLVGMGVLPLQFIDGENAASVGLNGFEIFDIEGIAGGIKPGMLVTIRAHGDDGKQKTFRAVTRIDTPYEIQYYQHGGILQYVLRQLIG